jgi:hypothetical protein
MDPLTSREYVIISPREGGVLFMTLEFGIGADIGSESSDGYVVL